MKLAVIGAGAMGTLFGARLALARNDVTMIDVVPQVIDAINERGILLENEEGLHTVPVAARRAEEMDSKVELAILFTKTVFSRSAMKASGSYIGPDTLVMTLQNGIGNEDILLEFVDRDRILLGVTNYPSNLVGPGHVSSQGNGYVRFMSLNGVRSEELERVENTLRAAGLNASITPDVMEAVWEKVAFNAVMNGTTAVCRLPVRGIAESEYGVSLARLRSRRIRSERFPGQAVGEHQRRFCASRGPLSLHGAGCDEQTPHRDRFHPRGDLGKGQRERDRRSLH